MHSDTEKIMFVVIGGTAIVLFLSLLLILYIVIFKKRQNRFLHEKEAFQQTLLLTQIEIQEQTLKNISQEIHDNIGQSLSLAKLNLSTIDIQKEQSALTKIGSTRDLVSKAILDLRDLSKSLNTDSILSAGLVKAIELELTLVEKSGEFQTNLIVTGTPVRIDPKKELILFRIIQEAVNNVIKHAKATSIDIKAQFTENSLSISVSDNGAGFIADRSADGSGLRNMKSRAALIGGSFEIITAAIGTTITITIPITEI